MGVRAGWLVTPTMEIPIGDFAVVADPLGAMFTVMRSNEVDD